jgi:hypothetical protein
MEEKKKILQEMQNCMREKEGTNSDSGKRRSGNAFEDVPAKVNSFNSSRSKKATLVRISELTDRGRARAKSSVENETGPGRRIKNCTILSGDMTESVHQLNTEMSLKDAKAVRTCTDLSKGFSNNLPVHSAFADSRSVGCQTADMANWEELSTMGVIMYSSIRKQSKMPARSVSPDIQRLPLCEQTQDSDERQSVRTKPDYRKSNATSMKTKQGSTQTAHDPFRLPPTYQRGIVPKYLQERLATMREEAEEFNRLVLPTTSSSQRVSGSESYKKSTSKVLKKHHSVLVQDAKGVHTRTDQSTDLSHNLPGCSRNLRCRSVDSRNLGGLEVKTYSSTGKQPRRNHDSDIREVHRCQSVRNEIEYGKGSVKSVRARQTSTGTANDPLRAPPTYQRGIVPNYLNKRKHTETTQKEAEQCKRCLPEPNCAVEHANDSYKKEYLLKLQQRHTNLVRDLETLNVKTDIRMFYKKRLELLKELKESEKTMRCFSELSILNSRTLSDKV